MKHLQCTNNSSSFNDLLKRIGIKLMEQYYLQHNWIPMVGEYSYFGFHLVHQNYLKKYNAFYYTLSS